MNSNEDLIQKRRRKVDKKKRYSDESKHYVEDIVPVSEIDKERYKRSKLREQQHNSSWLKRKVNINDVIEKFIPINETLKENTKGVKYEFEGNRYIIRCDKVSGYLRIYDKQTKMYCELDGTPSRNLEETHFKIKKREEM